MYQLTDSIYTTNSWNIKNKKVDKDQIINNGSIFLIGNGYMGYRGTLAEWNFDQYVGCFITDTYDKADNKWKELCNAPNPLYTKLEIGGESLSVFNNEIREHNVQLDLRHGVFKRSTVLKTKDNIEVQIESERFASLANLHLLPMKYSIFADKACNVKIKTGIDGRVWDLHGKHLEKYKTFEEDGLLSVQTFTKEKGIELDVVTKRIFPEDIKSNYTLNKTHNSIYEVLEFNIKKGEKFTFYNIASIYSSNDVEKPLKNARVNCEESYATSYINLKKENNKLWDELWKDIDIKIQNDPINQTALRFNLYQNIIATPMHSQKLPIGARGLSCQAYQGAAFWDQEIFNLPMYLFTRPEIAKNLLIYRFNTLGGAKDKAIKLGYEGAFYAWISGKTGQELCPSYFFKDVLSGREIHNHFNDWQIHVSPDIAYTVWYYYKVTGDFKFIIDYGAEIIFEVARFLYSHSYYKMDKGRFEFIRLLGPDEYHENIDNNAYTNYLSKSVLEIAIKIYYKMNRENKKKLERIMDRIDLKEKEIIDWEKMKENLYLPEINNKNKLIEQFDGYFDYEDATPHILKKRLLDPDEYWGWPNGVAVETQVIKQADVIQLFCINNAFDRSVMEKNYEYYEARTQHGSSLSPSAYAIIAAKVGLKGEAFDFFKDSLFIDLDNKNKSISGGTFIGGIHTAACGAAWQIVVKGFAGMEILSGGILFKPHIPKRWESFTFKIKYMDQKFRVQINHENIIINSLKNNDHFVYFTISDQRYKVNTGSSKIIDYRKDERQVKEWSNADGGKKQ